MLSDAYSSKILTRQEYYLLILTRLSFTILTFSISTYYKAFTLTFIESDAYITNFIGTVFGVVQCIGRFFYGFALDRIPYRIVLCFQTGLMAVLVGTLYLTSALGKEIFTLWMYLLNATFPGIFSILPGKFDAI